MQNISFSVITTRSSLLLSAVIAPAFAQEGTLRPLNAITGQTTPSYLADLDQDGRDDIVGGNPAFWMRSEPGNGFSAPRELADGSFSVVAEPIDADGDGDLDVLAVKGSQLFLLTNDGRMGFEPRGLPIQEGTGSPIAFDDFDGDGELDIVVGTISSLDYYPGLGAGNFGLRVPNPGFPGSLLDVADLNDDGRLDVLLRQGVDTAAWVTYSSLGQFAGGPVVVTGQGAISEAKAANVDAAGGLDVVAILDGDLVWFRRGVFGQYSDLFPIADTDDAFDLELGNFAGDQAPDILLTTSSSVSPQTSGFGLFVNGGSGTFGAEQVLLGATPGARSTLLAGDVDADGDQDLVFGLRAPSGDRGDIRLAEATAFGIYSAPASVLEPIGQTQQLRVTQGDVDGNGTTDLVVTDRLDGQAALKYLTGAGDGTFLATRSLDVAALNPGASGLTTLVADLNGDGFPDILVAKTSVPSEIFSFDGSPAGPAPGRPVGTLPAGSSLFSSSAADVDQDGDLDLVSLGDDLVWMANDGQGVFGTSTTIASPALSLQGVAFAPSITIEDFDGDGTDDIFIEGSTSFFAFSDARMFPGLTGGGFGAPVAVSSVTPSQEPFSIKPIDIDQDGDIDLVYSTAGASVSRLNVRENMGSFQFGALEFLFEADRNPTGELLTVDWDLDGDVDFVFLANSPSAPVENIEWVESFGGVSYAPQALLAGPRGTLEGLTLADLDGDLVLDIVTGDSSELALLGLLNEREVGNVYCASTENSSGRVASLSASGSPVAALNTLQLNAAEMPTNVFGFFLGATAPGQVPGAGGTSGVLCLGGEIGRYSNPFEIRNSGGSGSFSLALDIDNLRTPTGSTVGMAGQTWYFQAWFRDADPSPTSNLTSALSVTLR